MPVRITGGAPALERAIADLPFRYPGPGGAVAVLRRGAVLGAHAWGFADTAARIPFTRETPSLVCSITKQFTCATLLSCCPDPEALGSLLREALPALDRPHPTIAELCHNQSGLRDYWALAMLAGSPVEGSFDDGDARRLIRATRTLQFAPGTRYSYANNNFRILSDLLEAHTGRSFADLLRQRVLDPAGMPHARMNPDTATVAGGTVGYEGDPLSGFRPAVNRITWTGDAGLAASLDDLIAWERFIDASRDAPDALPSRLAAPVRFRDGNEAAYGFGLARTVIAGHAVTAHAGGLRGWRSFRLHAPAARISVVVLFNHMADPRAAAADLLAAATGAAPATEPAAASSPAAPAPADPVTRVGETASLFLDAELGIAARLAPAGVDRVRLHYASGVELLSARTDGALNGATSVLAADGDAGAFRLTRASENIRSRLVPVSPGRADDLEGVFRAPELDAVVTCVRAGGVLHGAFSGPLGQGAMERLVPHGRDAWLLPCPRALDYAAPGDWTLAVRRDDAGRIVGLRVGCWLARGIDYALV